MNNNERRTTMKPRWLSVFMLAFLPWLSGCDTASWPFEVQKAGTKIEVEYRAMEHRGYFFILSFMFKEGDEDGRKRIRKLLGDNGKDRNGNLIDAGIPISLRFKIYVIDTSGERLMLEQDISVLGLTSWGSESFDRQIAMVVLQPGRYRISVESLKDVPELVGTPVILA